MDDYRKSMASYLSDSRQMIDDLLSTADFDEGFPDVFGRPTDANPEVAVRNSCGLLLRKAQLHVAAVLMADRRNNLHSLTVHMRVILERAAQVVAAARRAHPRRVEHTLAVGGQRERRDLQVGRGA